MTVLGGSVIFSTGLGVWSLRVADAYLDRLDSFAQQALVAEKMNGAVASITAGNRGITSARNKAEMDDYLKEIRASVDGLDAIVAEWRAIVPEEGRADFEDLARKAGDLGRLRLKLADLGAREGREAAMDKLKEPVVRANRLALQKSLTDHVAAIRSRLDPLRADKESFHQQSVALLAIAALAALGIGLVVAIYVGTFMVVRPLRGVTRTLQKMESGDLSVAVPTAQGHDEIGDLWRTTAHFLASLRDAEALKAEQAQSDRRRATERARVMAEMADRFEGAVGGIVQSISAAADALAAQSREMLNGADATAAQLVTVAGASEEASSNVQTVASATEEMSASVADIGHRVAHSARSAREAEQSATATSEKVERLSSAADRIGAVVDLIASIASQTNLLALNATIEAARAGDAGRGFAVVANEVKNLAEQTARATGEIAAQVSGIQASTAESTASIAQITAVIRDLSRNAALISEALDQQSSVTTEIARNVQEAARGSELVAASIETVQGSATRSRNASATVQAAAQDLALQGDRLKAQVAAVLETLRAA
ncbi:methyl-accepting chemotaxis protein [Prosthecomicrobium sp. N25]|uniref:methyl-accepting chemotaxis protein n=1 Tax=Prosthecomicrobium sp. N25 TaxID=3129254 RepID=UPI003076A2F6